MSRATKIWLCLIATAFTMLAVSQALSSRQAHAQQPPPNPTPTPETCCDMPVGGLTIGGPGRGSGYIFASTRPRNICVTVKNDHTEDIIVSFFETAVPEVGGLGGDCPCVNKTIQPGYTATLCDSRTAVVHIFCPPTVCSLGAVRWRVDNAD